MANGQIQPRADTYFTSFAEVMIVAFCQWTRSWSKEPTQKHYLLYRDNKLSKLRTADGGPPSNLATPTTYCKCVSEGWHCSASAVIDACSRKRRHSCVNHVHLASQV